MSAGRQEGLHPAGAWKWGKRKGQGEGKGKQCCVMIDAGLNHCLHHSSVLTSRLLLIIIIVYKKAADQYCTKVISAQ